jgi:hypothetical protein
MKGGSKIYENIDIVYLDKLDKVEGELNDVKQEFADFLIRELDHPVHLVTVDDYNDKNDELKECISKIQITLRKIDKEWANAYRLVGKSIPDKLDKHIEGLFYKTKSVYKKIDKELNDALDDNILQKYEKDLASLEESISEFQSDFDNNLNSMGSRDEAESKVGKMFDKVQRKFTNFEQWFRNNFQLKGDLFEKYDGVYLKFRNIYKETGEKIRAMFPISNSNKHRNSTQKNKPRVVMRTPRPATSRPATSTRTR